MIYAELTGGLGNQMFIYAFARALGLETGTETALIDRRETGGPAHTAFGLGELALSPAVRILTGGDYAKKHLPAQNALKALMIRHEQRAGMMARDWNGFECAAAPFLNRAGLHFATDGYVPCRWQGSPKNLLAWGYFQGEQYFAARRAEVLAELRPAAVPADAQSAALAARIAAAAVSICLHVRRGDYQRPENAALQVCTPAYYAAAAARAARQWPGAVLFVFSDDIPWAEKTLDTAGLPTVFMAGPRTAAGELALMQRCRHFILSNSTFSWWAQELGTAADKTVIAPSRWYANGKKTALYGAGWQLIEV